MILLDLLPLGSAPALLQYLQQSKMINIMIENTVLIVSNGQRIQNVPFAVNFITLIFVRQHQNAKRLNTYTRR